MKKKSLTTSIYSFEDLIKGNFLYVDKTEYLWNLIEPYRGMYFLSRPRRFGKSLTLSTLRAVFEGKKELFKDLAIYDKPYDWKIYPVIHIDMNGRNFNSVESAERSLCEIVAEQARRLDVLLDIEDPSTMFQKLIEKLSVRGKVVVLIDEYDKPVLSNIATPVAADILRILKPFYSVIKEKQPMLRFAFVTGVTKFCHVSLFSDLNNLTDLTMMQSCATMLGYTQQEFENNFTLWIAETEKVQELSLKAFLAKIKNWYDGYKFHEKSESVYNPVSVANFFEQGGKFRNYWFSTGTPSFLMELIKQQKMDLEQTLAGPISDSAFGAFELEHIPALTLLLQTGYLTIKSARKKYDSTVFYLDFPNQEVSSSFLTYLLDFYSRKSGNGVKSFCYCLTDALVAGDLPSFQKAMEIFFSGIPYDVHHKCEANFQNIFFAIFKLLGFNTFAESKTSDGRIDAVVETEQFIYLFEFKLNQNDSALAQIKEKEYFKPFLLSPKEIILIGANFDTGTGRLFGWKDERL